MNARIWREALLKTTSAVFNKRMKGYITETEEAVCLNYLRIFLPIYRLSPAVVEDLEFIEGIREDVGNWICEDGGLTAHASEVLGLAKEVEAIVKGEAYPRYADIPKNTESGCEEDLYWIASRYYSG